MTRILDDRSPLDAALKDKTLDLLVLSGGSGGAAEAIHDKAEQVAADDETPWRVVFLIEKPSILRKEEADAWFNSGPDRAAVLCGPDHRVGFKEPCSALLLGGGKPSGVAIRHAWSLCGVDNV